MSNRNDLEYKALRLIMDSGPEGILQSKLWRDLKASSREGSRISLKLKKKGMIERKRELFNGRWTYRLFSKRRPVMIDSIMDIPCAMCDDINKCGEETTVSLISCNKMSYWLINSKDTTKLE